MDFVPHSLESPHRIDPRHFTRTRKLPLHRLIVFVLHLVARGRTEGMDIEAQTFFAQARQSGLWPEAEAASRSALSRRRALAPWTLFADLLGKALRLADELWTGAGHWHGLRVLAIDGSHFTLPATAPLRRAFDPLSGLEHPGKGHYPQCLIVTLYDVLRRLPLARAIVANDASEREQALALLREAGGQSQIVLFDRGFPQFDLLAALLHECKGHFLMRCPATSTFREIVAFAQSGAQEAIIHLRPSDLYLRQCSPERRQRAKAQRLVLRAIRLQAPDGKLSVLLTDLLDARAHSAADLRELYWQRWRVEEYFREEKVVMDVEAFHGKSENAIRQELFAAAIMTVIARLMANIAQHAQPSPNPAARPQDKNALIATAQAACLLAPENPRRAIALFEQLLERIQRVKYYPPPKKRPPQPRVTKQIINKWAFNKKAKLHAP